MFRFAGLPLGFPYLFAAVDLFSTSRFFWGGLALVLFALARLVSSSRFFFPPCSAAGNRWCFARRKTAFLSSPSRARVMRPRVPCLE